MPIYYLAVQSTYDGIEMALYNESHQVDYAYETKFNATKNLIPLIDQLLSNHHLTSQNLSFVVVNRGPGPFTTLRTVIATANALHFATDIPLIGIDGLEAFAHEHTDAAWPCSIYLLNAFAQDVYFCVQKNNKIESPGYRSINTLLNELAADQTMSTIRFIGNGALLHNALIKQCFGKRAYYPEQMPLFVNLSHIALAGYQQWLAKKALPGLTQHPTDASQRRTGGYLTPLYLKLMAL